MKLKICTNPPNFDILNKKIENISQPLLLKSENLYYWLTTDVPTAFEISYPAAIWIKFIMKIKKYSYF